MKASEACIELIKEAEGFRAEVYLDTGGVRTVGYGHAIKHGEIYDRPITQHVAEAILGLDLAEAEEILDDLVRVPLTQNQYDALASFAFNVGRGQFAKSTLLRKLNLSDYSAVPAELAKYVNDNGRRIEGLVRRRRAEIELWTNTPKNN